MSGFSAEVQRQNALTARAWCGWTLLGNDAQNVVSGLAIADSERAGLSDVPVNLSFGASRRPDVVRCIALLRISFFCDGAAGG